MTHVPASSHGATFNGGTITLPTTVSPSGIEDVPLTLNQVGAALDYEEILVANNATKEVFRVATSGDFILHTDTNASGALYIYTDDYSTAFASCAIGGGNGIEFNCLRATDLFLITTSADGLTVQECFSLLGSRKMGFFDKAIGAAPASQQVLPAAAGLQDFQSVLRAYGLISSANATVNALTPKGIITSGALPTQQLVTATGAQVSTTRDVETFTPVTFNPGAATTATCTIELSPDNVTYSTLGVETVPAGVALDGTIHVIPVRVPAGWYIKLTVNAQAVLGLTTYY